jgi:DNA-binding NtrC family response regulator
VKVLVIDDQRSARLVLRRMLTSADDLEVIEVGTLDQADRTIEANSFDLLLVDVRLSDSPTDRGGLELLRRLRLRGDQTPAVMVTASSELAEVREAMRLGAQDYVFKDELCPEMLLPIVEGIRERHQLRGEVRRLREQMDRTCGPSAIIGSSPGIERVRRLVERVADSDLPVLIRGETGTGKELVARAIHSSSQRHSQPFLAVNCSALPGTLVESLIFGHERGAFTGADRRLRGQLELAGSGTVLLDEIAEMPLELQAKLLRVLEDRCFRPLGAEQELPLKARVLAATHVDLERRMHAGRFREDLYYRLNVVSIELPPLGERGNDVAELLQCFVSELPCKLRFHRAAVRWLTERRWPGNVRELRNLVDRLALLAERDVIDVKTLVDITDQRGGPRGTDFDLREMSKLILAMTSQPGSKLDLIERAVLEQALGASGGNKSEAARLVGIDRKTFERHYERLATAGPASRRGRTGPPDSGYSS